MKSSLILAAAGAAFVGAQDLSGLPPCGQTCISNMIGIATSRFGCAQGDVRCYCCNANFGYGVRDCATQACRGGDSTTVIQFGSEFCKAAVANGCGNTNGGNNNSSNGGNNSSNPSSTTNGAPTVAPVPAPSPSGSQSGSGDNNSTSSQDTNSASSTGSADTTTTESGSASETSGSASPSESASGSGSNNESGSGNGGSGGNNNGAGTSTDSNGNVVVTQVVDGNASGGGAFVTAAPLLGAGALAAMLLL